MRPHQCKFTAIFFVTLLLVSTAQANELALSEYLEQVSRLNPAIRAAEIGQTSAKMQINDANLLFLPQLELSAQRKVSEQDTYVPMLYGSKTVGEDYKIAVQEMTNFGLKGDVYYDLKSVDITGAAPNFVPVPKYYSTEPGVELTQSLWRNGWGAESRAQEVLIRSGAEANFYAEKFHYLAAVVEAKNTFLELYFLRKALIALRASRDFAGKLRDWARARAQNELADKSDFLQTEAVFEQRDLELMKNENDLRSTALRFNSLRGIDSDVVSDELAPQPLNEPVAINKFTLSRLDTKATEKSLAATKAKSKMNEESAKPTLDIFASFAYTRNDITLQQAEDFGQHPVYAYGVKFTTPLAFTKADRVANSFAKEIESTEFKLKKQKIDETRDLDILIRQIGNARDRLRLAEKIEASQTTKLESERERHRRGRTTLFQVLQFEQDHVSAQLNRINTELEYRTAVNQLELYESETK